MNEEKTMLMNKEQFDSFVKGELLNFMAKHDLQKVTIDDGCGKKGVIKRGAQGEYKVQVTNNETL